MIGKEKRINSGDIPETCNGHLGRTLRQVKQQSPSNELVKEGIYIAISSMVSLFSNSVPIKQGHQ
jgi:hypothetical protein